MLQIENNNERILLKYCSKNFTLYKCIIPKTDNFVIDFCGGDLQKLEKIISENHKIIEMENFIAVEINEPIILKYKLIKEENQEIIDKNKLELILQKLDELKNENEELKMKLQRQDMKFSYITLINEYNYLLISIEKLRIFGLFFKNDNFIGRNNKKLKHYNPDLELTLSGLEFLQIYENTNIKIIFLYNTITNDIISYYFLRLPLNKPMIIHHNGRLPLNSQSLKELEENIFKIFNKKTKIADVENMPNTLSIKFEKKD